MEAVLTYYGHAVSTEGLDIDSLRFNVNGFLSSFKTKETEPGADNGVKYIFTRGHEFVDKGRHININEIKKYTSSGYYEEIKYLEYYKDRKRLDVREIDSHLTKFVFNKVKEGDIIEVPVHKENQTSTEFYKTILYTFPHDGRSGSYKKDGKRELDINDVLTIVGVTSNEQPQKVQNSNANAFYSNYLSKLDIVPIFQRDQFTELIINIALRIGMIENTVFPILTSNNCSDVLMQDLINDLHFQWQAMPEDELINVQYLASYLHNLSALYAVVYRNKIIIESSDCIDRYILLIDLASPNALAAIPYVTKTSLLRSFIENQEFKLDTFSSWNSAVNIAVALDTGIIGITAKNQQVALKIIASLNLNEYDEFLESFLLRFKDGGKTYYEIFYNLMDDTVVSEIFGLSWFTKKRTNRKHFVNAIYQLWLKSKYNMNYHANNPNLEEVNENSFFLLPENIDTYWFKKDEDGNDVPKNAVFEYFYWDIIIASVEIGYRPVKLKGKEIEFETYVKAKDIGSLYVPDRNSIGSVGSYHLYQPISVISYQESLNLGIRVPDSDPIPAFLLQYTQEYKEVEELIATTNLIVELSLEVILTIGTGSISSIRHIRHMPHITKWRQALNSSSGLEAPVLFWKGLEGVTEVVSISAGVLGSFNQYINTTTGNQELKDLTAKLNYVFLFTALASGGGANIATKKASKAADEVIDEIQTLNNAVPPIPHNIPEDILEIITKIRTGRTGEFNDFQTILNNLDETIYGGAQGIKTKFNSLSPSDKLDFWLDFNASQKNHPSFWLALNENNAVAFDRWQNLKVLGTPDRNQFRVLTETDTYTGYTNLFEQVILRDELFSLNYTRRFQFVKLFGNIDSEIFDILKVRPDKIAEWSNASDDLKVILKQTEYFWLNTDFTPPQLKAMADYLTNGLAIRQFSKPNYNHMVAWYADPLRKEELIARVKRFSLGNALEKPFNDFLKNTLTDTQRGYTSVDIRFFDANGDVIGGDNFELDGLVYDITTNKFEKIYSVKIPDEHDPKGDISKMTSIFKNIPDGGDDFVLHIIDNYTKNFRDKQIIRMESYEYQGTDIITGETISWSPADFKNAIKNFYSKNFDFVKIYPETFGVTKEDLHEYVYQFLKQYFN
ncbi:hypothetical protein GCM10011344_40310 [Dokdonia pacifica]|uniref:Uncharacterized protein n=1 Tax=Dokdonia pacifica TaxID=1627892 RepID=A0A239A7U7_9FLAO|nr:hypothetical protein [Dokdonia pacifica]GGG35404.1 hypothetical protein GCM10011344_40310 [Dokdonia pacifica]SNR91640.1 hypothetical protein SAMN06265376_104212 [Dokdonia pacifica]